MNMKKMKVLAAALAAFAAVPLWALDESVPEIRERISNGWWRVACYKPGTNGGERVYRDYAFGEPVDWTASDVRDVGPGTKIVCLATKAEGIPNKIYAVRVDLSTPRLDIVGSLRCDVWGTPMTDVDHVRTARTLRETTAEFMVRNRAAEGRLAGKSPVFLALNCVGWGPWASRRDAQSTYADPASPLYSFGQQISGEGFGDEALQKRKLGIFVFYDDRTADIVSVVTPELAKRVRFSAACFVCRLVANGEVSRESGRDKSRAQRTSLGLSKERRHLYFVVCDGRDKAWSRGLNFRELAEVHKAVGSWDAINLDGGGSTTLLTWDAKRNQPYMHNWQTGLRRNGSNIGLSQAPAQIPCKSGAERVLTSP